MKGTIFSLFFSLGFNPRTREGYDNIIFASSSYVEHFNPRTHEGYDEIAGNDMDYISALIPVPMKGTTSFITREIINDMF